MKKKILLVLTMSLLVVLLVGCSNSKSEDTDNKTISEKKENITEHVIYSFDLEHHYTDYFTVYGNVSDIDSDEDVVYNSTNLTKKLNASEKSYIEFEIENPMHLTVYSYKNDNQDISINDTEYKFENDEVNVDLKAGKYKIKNPKSDIYYIDISEINNTKTLIFDNGDSISFNPDNTKVEKTDEKIRYTFDNKMIIDEYSDGKVELVQEGNDGSSLDTEEMDTMDIGQTNEQN